MIINSNTVLNFSSIAPPTVDVKPIVYNFELGTGNKGAKTVIEPLLKTRDVAEQRARSEFMKHGYTRRPLAFSTYRTDLVLNQIISVRGLKFKITDIIIESDDRKIITHIKGVRYE